MKILTVKSILVFCTLLFLAGCQSTDAPAPYVHYGISGGADSAGVHMVDTGDTLWSIADRYKLDMPDIIAVNKLSAPYTLHEGDRLKIPPPRLYTVKSGDTLYEISRLFNVSMTETARLNTMRSPYTIHPGDKLRMPTPYNHKAASLTPRQKQVKQRVTQKAKAVRQVKVPPRTSGKFSWPVDGRVISGYGPKKDGLHNNGINIAAPKGAPVRAAESGVVVYADNKLKGYGNLVLVRHDGGWITAYAHLNKMKVRSGQTISRGTTLGTVGETGFVDSPQLHFEIRKGKNALNPMTQLSKTRS